MVTFPCFVLSLLWFSAMVEPSDDLKEMNYGVDMCPERVSGPDCFSSRVEDDGPEMREFNDSGSIQMALDGIKSLIKQQQKQLEHLEGLVRKLDRSIDALRGEISHQGTYLSPSADKIVSVDVEELTNTENDVEDLTNTENDVMRQQFDFRYEAPPMHVSSMSRHDAHWQTSSSIVRNTGVMTVAQYKPTWSEHFQFVSAVKVDGQITCLHVLPQDGEGGLSKFIAVGADNGRVYIFFSHGDPVVDFMTTSHTAVTAMLSFSRRQNETMLLTGHVDGMVSMHKLSEVVHGALSGGDDATTLVVEHMNSLVMPSSTTTDAHNPVTILEAYRIGRMRYILISDASGGVHVFWENGTLYGTTKSPSQPLAFLRSPNSQRLLFLTRDGAAALDLRSMAIQSGVCEGLDAVKVVAYVFDVLGRTRAYGFTEDGHMIFTVVLGNALRFECHVRSKKKLEVQGPVVLLSIKGYLIVGTPMEVMIYNSSLQIGFSQAPRQLFKASMDEISQSFLNIPIQSRMHPAMACNRDRLVVIAFGDGYVGMYRSTLPMQKPASSNSKLWASPVVLAVLIFLGGQHFLGRKRATPTGVPQGSGELRSNRSPTVRSDQGAEGLMDSRKQDSGTVVFPGNMSGYANLRNQNHDLGFGMFSKNSSLKDKAVGGGSTVRSPSINRHLHLKGELGIDPQFRGLAMDAKYKSSAMDSSFESSSLTDPVSLESAAYLKRHALGLKSGVPGVQPTSTYRVPAEHNSF